MLLCYCWSSLNVSVKRRLKIDLAAHLYRSRTGFLDLCDELIKEGALGNDIVRMEYMNKLFRSALSFGGGESWMLCCAVLLGGKAGNTWFEVHTFRIAINRKAVGVKRSTSEIRTSLRPKMPKNANPPRVAF